MFLLLEFPINLNDKSYPSYDYKDMLLLFVLNLKKKLPNSK
jgi:hypothetical protein